MFFESVNDNENINGFVNMFMGYNHNPIINDGEFYEMQNMTSDHYPLLAPRKKRESVLALPTDDYKSITLVHTTKYESDIVSTSIHYTFNEVTVDGELKLKWLMSSLNVFDSLQLTIRFSNDNGLVSERIIDIEPYTDIEMEITPEASKVQFIVDGVFTDPSSFDPDDIETYVYDCALQEQIPTIRGMLVKDNKLAYFIKQNLYYDGEVYDFSDYIGTDDMSTNVQLITMGAYIYIFPLNLYINTQDTDDMGRLDAVMEDTGEVTYTLCRADGTGYDATASATEPEDPSNGDYWLDTTQTGLYVWSEYNKSWNPVLTTYIAITFPNADPSDYFAEGDAVYLNTKYEDINNGSVIQAVGEDYIVVTGIMDSSTDTETFTGKIKVERRVPKFDYACVSQNRMWACYKGEDANGKVLNEIYASKLGDPKNWYCYEGSSSDSYAVSLGDDGDFTGAVSYQGMPTFFKENKIYKIYGSYPAQYQLYAEDQRGVQKGSERSLAICGDYLIYKSISDVCIYDGSRPTTISEPLGIEIYKDAVAGSTLNKYYLSVIDQENNSHLFVYDLNRNMWHREDDLRILSFAYNNFGKLYGVSKLKVYSFGVTGDDFELTKETAETHIDWYVESGIIGLTFTTHNYVNEMTIRAKIGYDAMLRVLVSYDDNDFEELRVIEGRGKLESYNFAIRSDRADHYRIRIEGRNDVLVYSIATKLEEGSVEDGI